MEIIWPTRPVAQQVAQQLDSLMVAPILVDPGAPCLLTNPGYTENDLPLIQDQCLEGWWKTVKSRVILPKHLRKSFFVHCSSHTGV